MLIETDQIERNNQGWAKLCCTYTKVETHVLINESFERNNVERKLKYVEKKRKSMMEADVNNLPFSFSVICCLYHLILRYIKFIKVLHYLSGNVWRDALFNWLIFVVDIICKTKSMSHETQRMGAICNMFYNIIKINYFHYTINDTNVQMLKLLSLSMWH